MSTLKESSYQLDPEALRSCSSTRDAHEELSTRFYDSVYLLDHHKRDGRGHRVTKQDVETAASGLLKFDEVAGPSFDYALSLEGVAEFERDHGNKEKAINLFEKGAGVYKSCYEFQKSASASLDAALVCEEAKQTQKADRFFQEALKTAELDHITTPAANKLFIDGVKMQYGKALIKRDDLVGAEKYLSENTIENILHPPKPSTAKKEWLIGKGIWKTEPELVTHSLRNVLCPLDDYFATPQTLKERERRQAEHKKAEKQQLLDVLDTLK